MTEETAVGTAETQPADDLRSTLAAAFTESETSAAEPVEAPSKPSASASDTAEPKETRERGPDGKFVKKADTETEAEPAEAAAPAEPKEGEEGAAPEPAEQPKEEDKHAALLKPWKAADQEMFKKLAPDAQEFLSRRYKEMEGDYTKKLQANARLRTEYEPIDKMFEPHREVMKQKGFTPAGLVEAWSNVEKKLNQGPEDAAGVIAGLIRGYNVPGAVLAKALGIAPPAQPAAQQTNGVAPDNPQTNGAAAPVQLPQEFLNEFGQMKQALHGFATERQAAMARAQQSAQEKAQQDIESFKSEKDKEGTLLRPHYDDVESDMLALANAAIASKQPVPALSELYEKAVWANPATREKLLTAQTQAAEAKRVAQEKAKAAAARKASASVTGAPGSGQATSRATPERSLREELEAHLADNAA